MSNQIVITADDGTKLYITDREVAHAHSLLLRTGYTMADAVEKALDLAVGIAIAPTLSITDLLYQKTGYSNELQLLATINSKLGTNDYELSTPHSK